MFNVVRSGVVLGGLLIVALLAGCFLFPIGVGPSGPFDGTWRVAETPAGSVWCITIQNDEIVSHEGGCDPPLSMIVSASPGTISGPDYQWIAVVRHPVPGDDIRYVYNVQEQPGGSLAGTAAQAPVGTGGAVGPATVTSIVMTRN